MLTIAFDDFIEKGMLTDVPLVDRIMGDLSNATRRR